MAGRGRWPAFSMTCVLLTWIVCCNCVLGYMHFGRKMSAAALAKYLAGHNMTDLQHHVEFFDKNKDGIITVTESIQSFIAIGCEPVFATTAATSTHAAFGPLITPVINPSLFLRNRRENEQPGKLPSTDIHISHIHGAIHASDTCAYNKKGMFVPENFDKIFKKHSHIKPDALAWWEVEEMLTANRDLLKPWTWPAAELEWQLIYVLGKDSRGYLHRDTVRGIYDGSVFPKLAARTADLHSEA